MKVLIYDKGFGRFSDTATLAAERTFESSVDSVQKVAPSTRPAVDVEQLRSGNLVVCHLESGPGDPSWDKFVNGDTSSLLCIIRVSSQGHSGMGGDFRGIDRPSEAGPWIMHLLRPSSDLSSDDWRLMFKLIRDWNFEVTPPGELRAFFEPTHEAVHALRLLCEAFLDAKGEPSFSYSGTSLTVYSPCYPRKWLAPFAGIEGDSGGAIASHFGAAEKEAATFFGKLSQLDPDASLDFDEWSETISELKTKLEGASI